MPPTTRPSGRASRRHSFQDWPSGTAPYHLILEDHYPLRATLGLSPSLETGGGLKWVRKKKNQLVCRIPCVRIWTSLSSAGRLGAEPDDRPPGIDIPLEFHKSVSWLFSILSLAAWRTEDFWLRNPCARQVCPGFHVSSQNRAIYSHISERPLTTLSPQPDLVNLVSW